MKKTILQNVFVSISVLFTLTGLLTAATSDGILDFGDTPLCHSHPTFITFDPPGSTFTFPTGINPGGVITGSYNDASGMGHGFVRARDGTYHHVRCPERHRRYLRLRH